MRLLRLVRLLRILQQLWLLLSSMFASMRASAASRFWYRATDVDVGQASSDGPFLGKYVELESLGLWIEYVSIDP